jgi:hypothetical protein
MTARANNSENFGRKVRENVTEWSSPGFFALERRAQNDSKTGVATCVWATCGAGMGSYGVR